MIEIIQTIVFMSALYFSTVYIKCIVKALKFKENYNGRELYVTVISWGLFYYLTIKY